MVHICTIHWKDDRWIDIQLEHFHKHIQQPFRVYAFLNHIEKDHSKKFFYSSTEAISSHPKKLNLLAELILKQAKSEDWLVFIDGDAFLINNLDRFGQNYLPEFPVVAVQRKENGGDKQPHPSFCLTTVGCWEKIRGDWMPGYQWPNEEGEMVTDVGGNLLGILEKEGISWHPMLRSNKKDIHPLYFGIYEDLVYHHGAGFREPISRVDFKKYHIDPKSWWFQILSRSPRFINRYINPARRIARKNAKMSEAIFEKILNGMEVLAHFNDENAKN